LDAGGSVAFLCGVGGASFTLSLSFHRNTDTMADTQAAKLDQEEEASGKTSGAVR
jgi:hypothetical protein